MEVMVGTTRVKCFPHTPCVYPLHTCNGPVFIRADRGSETVGASPGPSHWSEAEGPKTQRVCSQGLWPLERTLPALQGPWSLQKCNSGSAPTSSGVAARVQWWRLWPLQPQPVPGLHSLRYLFSSPGKEQTQ